MAELLSVEFMVLTSVSVSNVLFLEWLLVVVYNPCQLYLTGFSYNVNLERF